MTQVPARLDEVDVARGVALGGMLLVNLGMFSGAARMPLAHQSGPDWAASLLVLLLAEGKFYPLFALLFGWGIARRQSAAVNAKGFFFHNLRRMAVLAAIGLLHAVFLWQGDILFVYALIGMLLPLLRGVPARGLALLVVIMLLLAAFLAMPGLGDSLHAAYSGWVNPLLSDWLGLPGRNPWIHASPIRFHIVQFAWKLAYFPDWLGNFAALILVGYASGIYAGGRYAGGRYASGMKASGNFASSSFAGGKIANWKTHGLKLPASRTLFCVALPLNLFYALTGAYPFLLPPAWDDFLRILALSLGGPLLALGYALGIARCYQSPTGRWLLAPVRKIGRMPLTTYISQSAVGALLFPFNSPGATAPVLIWPLAGGIFLAQLLFASLWLNWFRQGPFEWLWRKLSH